tara:strand:- start:404 stop:2707 length:2304 start_codon:yes stop_codon:yes gene_type:complete
MPSYNKKDFRESNVNYLNKEFNEIKQSLITYAKSYFPNTYRDFNEASPGMMLLEMNAYVGDVMSFYIDQQYREMLLPLAEERRSIINLAKMFGYKVKPIIPAVVDITFTQEVDPDSEDKSKIDYGTAGAFPSGIQVSSTANSQIIFETLDVVDFTVSGSNDTDASNITSTDANGLVTKYTISRNVRAVSGETKTKTFDVGAPTKFLKLTLPDTNVIDIISCVDSNNNKWYEVDYLAQDKVPIETHYTNDNDRDNAYTNESGELVVTDVAVPYSLSYIQTNKRFTRETNVDNTTSLIFGNGILKNGTSITSDFLDLEQAGIVIPGQTGDISSELDPLLGDEYSTLGETPIQTTMTITYRVGGGINANVAANTLTSFTSPTAASGTGTLSTATNNRPATGGQDEETVDEIREKAKAHFSTQNRCVTKEDYEARILNIPSKFGAISKAYVSRENVADIMSAPTEQIKETIDGFTTNIETQIDNMTIIDLANYEQIAEEDEILGYNITNEQAAVIQNNSNALANLLDGGGTGNSYTSGIRDSLALLPDIPVNYELGTIHIYTLAYDNNKNLVGNPIAGTSGFESLTDGIPTLLQNNVKSYVDNFKILTDEIVISDGYIINFGVFFDVISHKFAEKNTVKLQCIEKIKDYFRVDKMQFSQPIYVSQLEYELMDVDGVRSVNYVTISQTNDYNAGLGGQTFSGGQNLYTYQYDPDNGDILTPGDGGGNGVEGYGYKYDFQSALNNGVILPPHPSNPGVFELKNPNQNIIGVVR